MEKCRCRPIIIERYQALIEDQNIDDSRADGSHDRQCREGMSLLGSQEQDDREENEYVQSGPASGNEGRLFE